MENRKINKPKQNKYDAQLNDILIFSRFHENCHLDKRIKLLNN